MDNPFERLTTDETIKSWALHSGKDGKHTRYYLYISSNPDVVKDNLGMSVRVDLMGPSCATPDEAIINGHREYTRQVHQKRNRVFPPREIIQEPKKETAKDMSKLSIEELMKELGL